MINTDITLILPSLNVADYIGETLKSACEQTFNNIEIICVDAGSTDGTLEIIKEAAENDPRIRLIQSEKKSYGYQCNLGIDEASGKYIAILETDDYVDPEMYGTLFEVAEKEKADYVKADYDAFFTQDNGSYYFFTRHTFSDKSMYNRVLDPSENIVIGRDDWYLWQGIYSRDFLIKNDIRFSETPGAAFQDIGFLFWTGAKAGRAYYINNIFYHYRIDRDGASSNLGRGLKFSYGEFSAIINRIEELNDVTLSARQLLFARMIKSFVSGYSRIDESWEAIAGRKEVYEWFRKTISDAFDKGYASRDIILSGHLDRLECLLSSEESYLEKYSMETFEKFISGSDKYALFGCGDFGYKAFCSLKKNDKTVIAFFDNNELLWGKTMNGIAISNPENARTLSLDIPIIIANEAHFEEIKTQLINMGIKKERISVFR